MISELSIVDFDFEPAWTLLLYMLLWYIHIHCGYL